MKGVNSIEKISPLLVISYTVVSCQWWEAVMGSCQKTLAVGGWRSAVRNCSEAGFTGFVGFSGLGETCDKSHYYEQGGESQESGIGVPSYQE